MEKTNDLINLNTSEWIQRTDITDGLDIKTNKEIINKFEGTCKL